LRGGWVFLVFFGLFTLASLAVPVPLFPGNMVHVWVDLPSTDFVSFVSAATNGVTYGLVVWLVFVLATRKLDESGVADYQDKKSRGQHSNKRRAVKH